MVALRFLVPSVEVRILLRQQIKFDFNVVNYLGYQINPFEGGDA